MRSKARSSAPCATTRKIGQRVADLLALVEARAADDAVVEAERDEAVLELAHLEGRADENGHVVQIMAAALQALDGLADGARLFLRIPGGMDDDLVVVRVGAVGEQRLAEPALIVGDEMRGGGEDVGGRAVVALQPDDRGAGEILLEAQDVVDLGAAPAVDRLVVVADAADVDCGVARGAALAPRLEGRVGRAAAGAAASCSTLGTPAVGLAALRRLRARPPPQGGGRARASGRCAISRSHMYCAVLVSWYSSTRMYLNLR